MIEPIMYFALGLLTAGLLALAAVPVIHARAVRLTRCRLETAMPLSMAEMQADKDQLRAQFAMSMRRLEVNVEQLRDKTTSQLAELGKRSQTINRLELDLCEKTAAIFALETRDRALRDQLCEAEEELAARTGILRELERTLADKEQQLAWITADRDEPQVTADGQRVEAVAQKLVDGLRRHLEMRPWKRSSTALPNDA
jgi:chromosome segregation ATPase